MTKLESRVLEWSRRQKMLARGERVLVALSGGADSVCLLRALLALGDVLGISVAAGHYNHQLRGADSLRDETFVRGLCEKLHVPLTVSSGDVAGEAKRSGRSVEDMARSMRYAFLEEAARAAGADRIATGHHADDNTETVLLHLTRGAGLRGLGGIPPKRGGIIRPLLSVERHEIMDYLTDLDQDFVEDATNADTLFRRNAIRHEVVPLLKEQNPNLAQTILRQSELLRRDAAYLDTLAKRAFKHLRSDEGGLCLSVEELGHYDPAMASRIAALAIQAAGGEAEAVHIEQVLDIAESKDPSAQTMVPGLLVRREYDRLIFAPPFEKVTFAPVELPQEGRVLLPEIGLCVTVTAGLLEDQQKDGIYLFQRAAICGKITLRPRKAGDTLRLWGRSGTKSVKKWMIEWGIPAHRREAWPVFADEDGVIAVFDHGIAARAAPTDLEDVITIVVEEDPCIRI